MVINDTAKATEKKKQSESVKTPLEQMKRDIKQRKVDECFGCQKYDIRPTTTMYTNVRIA